MRQPLGEYDDRNDDVELVGDDRADEFTHQERRLPMVLVSLFTMALFAGGLWFAYVEGTRHPSASASSAPGAAMPLIRADQQPSKVRPEQPGGMKIPDQDVTVYNEKPGGPAVEKLLPEPEQPMPRPAPAATGPAASPPAAPAASAPPAANPQAPAAAAAPPAAKAAPRPTLPSPRAQTATTASPHAASAKGKPIRVQLASLRDPGAARAEWARLKREQPDLLGKLTAVAVRADLGDKGTFYRIEAGSFRDAAAAERLCGELKRHKLACSLVR